MTTALLQKIAATNEWWAIAPELLLGCSALALLALEIVLPRKDHRSIPLFALATQATVFVLLLAGLYSDYEGTGTFGGLLQHSFLGHVARVFFLLSSLLVCFLAGICLPRSKMPRVEFYHIVMVVTAAMMLLVQSAHFVMFFVALETVTIGFYILVSYYRDRPLTLEAGLKYLVLGALSSAIMLFGIVLLYGAVGKVMIAGVAHTGFEFAVAADFLRQHPDSFLGLAGALLVVGGVAFKIGAFPFQIWIPDVYQGAPTPVTAFLAVASKAAGFAVLLTLVGTVFAPLQAVLVPVLSLLAAATIIFGNLSALTQRNTKRLMGLSGVSHAGYLLLGVIASFRVEWAPAAVWFYLFTYLLASMAVFGVMAHLAGPDERMKSPDSPFVPPPDRRRSPQGHARVARLRARPLFAQQRGHRQDLEKVDLANPDESIDRILKFVDYGHASIGGLTGGLAIALDDVSMWLAYKIFEIAQMADGQESSTRYITMDAANLPTAASSAFPPTWRRAGRSDGAGVRRLSRRV
jgi:NADH-quinone oxidoreductase subunit N